MLLTFKKLSNRWFIDIPYDGDIGDLEMVMGADKLLDKLPQISKDIVEINISNTPTLYRLDKIEETDVSCTYYTNNPKFEGEIWLCNVTKLVLGEFPETIYFKPIFELY